MISIREIGEIIPLPPFILIRSGKFPDCIKIFRNLDLSTVNMENIGKGYMILSRLTGSAWIIWLGQFLVFLLGLSLLLYHWALNIPMTTPMFQNNITCKMLLAMIAAIFILSSFIFNAIVAWSFAIAEKLDSRG